MVFRDMTLCANRECPSADHCKRQTLFEYWTKHADSSTLASISYFELGENTKCDYYVPITGVCATGLEEHHENNA